MWHSFFAVVAKMAEVILMKIAPSKFVRLCSTETQFMDKVKELEKYLKLGL